MKHYAKFGRLLSALKRAEDNLASARKIASEVNKAMEAEVTLSRIVANLAVKQKPRKRRTKK